MLCYKNICVVKVLQKKSIKTESTIYSIDVIFGGVNGYNHFK